MSDEKKLIERQRLDLFKELFPDFPKGKIKAGESPDFVVRSRHRSVGIELTELFFYAASTPSVNDASDWKNGFLVQLTRLLQKKEEKLSYYRLGRHNKYWLLIAYECAGNALTVWIMQELKEMVFESGFESVYLVCTLQKTVIQLRLGN